LVDRDAQRAGGERLDHRQHAPQLFLGRDRRGAGPRGLAADVQDRRALRGQSHPVLDRGLGLEEQPAVRKRVRRDVDDAHDGGWAHPRIIGPAGTSPA
jgi:hypothetical protein